MLRLRSASRLVVLIAGTLAFSTVPAHATRMHRAPREVKQQIAELEQQWRNATLTGDAAALDKLLSEDYVGISWNGQVNTKATQLDRLRTRSLQLTRMDLSDVKIKVVKAVAIVTSLAELQGTSEGSPMSGTFRYTRVYQRLPGGIWKITNFEATRVPVHMHRPENAESAGSLSPSRD